MDIAIRVKKALFDKGWTQKKLCAELNITETGLKYTMDNNSWKVETLDKISGLLGLSITYFLVENEENLDSKFRSNSNGAFGEHVIEELKAMFEEEIRAKNQQIAGLQRTVDVLVGKSEGAFEDHLSTVMSDFNGTYNEYTEMVGSVLSAMMLKPTKKSAFYTSRAEGASFSFKENLVVNK